MKTKKQWADFFGHPLRVREADINLRRMYDAYVHLCYAVEANGGRMTFRELLHFARENGYFHPALYELVYKFGFFKPNFQDRYFELLEPNPEIEQEPEPTVQADPEPQPTTHESDKTLIVNDKRTNAIHRTQTTQASEIQHKTLITKELCTDAIHRVQRLHAHQLPTKNAISPRNSQFPHEIRRKENQDKTSIPDGLHISVEREVPRPNSVTNQTRCKYMITKELCRDAIHRVQRLHAHQLPPKSTISPRNSHFPHEIRRKENQDKTSIPNGMRISVGFDTSRPWQPRIPSAHAPPQSG